MNTLSFVRRIRRMAGTTTRCAAALALAAGSAGCVHQPRKPFTFVQMCDPQLGFGGHDADVKRFRQAARQINELHPDFVVICGDLVNHASEGMFAEFNALKGWLNMPCYCAPGNHDVGNTPTQASLARYRKTMGKDFFSFEHKGCEFVVVDSQLWKSPLSGQSEEQELWLKKSLEAAAKRQRPIFLIDHYPLFVKTADEDEQYYNLPKPRREELLKLFKQSSVVAVLSGHTHRTIIHSFDDIQMVASQTTSRNFDGEPFGFRVWHVSSQRPYRHEFVPLVQAVAEP